MPNLNERLHEAVRRFWQIRSAQGQRQGQEHGDRDRGNRSAVTGGGHLAAVIELVCEELVAWGVPASALSTGRTGPTLPGYFRATKAWDLLAVLNGQLLAVIEFKSHIGPSFGNNYNNRCEEAVGNAHDLWTAYREGAYSPSSQPWVGYLMVLEDAPASGRPLSVSEPHFDVFEEFRGASYEERYIQLCLRLVRERMYSAACLVLSDRQGNCRQPCNEATFARFMSSLRAHVVSAADRIAEEGPIGQGGLF